MGEVYEWVQMVPEGGRAPGPPLASQTQAIPLAGKPSPVHLFAKFWPRSWDPQEELEEESGLGLTDRTRLQLSPNPAASALPAPSTNWGEHQRPFCGRGSGVPAPASLTPAPSIPSTTPAPGAALASHTPLALVALVLPHRIGSQGSDTVYLFLFRTQLHPAWREVGERGRSGSARGASSGTRAGARVILGARGCSRVLAGAHGC